MDLDASMIPPLFGEYIQAFTDFWDILASDASKTESLISIAGCTNINHFSYKVQQVNSIFMAEALVIGVAIDEFVSISHPMLILTDSLSVLLALQYITLKSLRVILWLHNKINRMRKFSLRFSLYWVPGHRGIPLNVKADGLPRSVSASDPSIDWIAPEDLIRALFQEIKLHSECSFETYKYYISHGDSPNINQSRHRALNRRDDVLVSRLLCKMVITPAMLARFKLVADSRCHMVSRTP